MNEFARCLIDLDVAAARRLWPVVNFAVQCGPDHEVLATLHLARTESEIIPTKLRQFSHAWLIEHGYPSKLPDIMKPKSEQIGPSRIVSAVGIAVHSELPGVGDAVRTAMERAVADAYAEGREDPKFVKARMEEAKAKELRALGLK